MFSRNFLLIAAGAAVVAAQVSPPCSQYDPTKKLETPCNIELSNTTEYQIRVYGVGSQQAFTNAAVTSADWKGADSMGFELNFAYISGSNSASSKIPMTAPVICRTNNSYNWDIGFFVPASLYPTLSSMPAPTDANVTILPVPLTSFAVIEFPGFATESDFLTNSATLRAYLARDNINTIADSWGEVWAQYDAPLTIFNRHNEVWVHISL